MTLELSSLTTRCPACNLVKQLRGRPGELPSDHADGQS
jgi:hypothetical protein